MTRGEIWMADVGRKLRPVLVLTRSEVIDVRQLVTVAEITSSIRGLAVEVALDGDVDEFERPSVINCDGLHTIRQTSLIRAAGRVSDRTMADVCEAIGYALGC